MMYLRLLCRSFATDEFDGCTRATATADRGSGSGPRGVARRGTARAGEVRHCDIQARRTDADYHDLIDITAFNTDGYDVTGRNVWIHDSSVWNQDDCIAVKDGSENMLFEVRGYQCACVCVCMRACMQGTFRTRVGRD